jgi:iron complex transport system substrate-binding protein
MMLLIAGSAFTADTKRAARTIVDMAGRTVTIPAAVNSVYSTSPMGEIIMYVLSPHKITGRTWALSGEDAKFLLDEYLNKPVLGGWYGKNTTGNPEVIISARPDIVLSMGLLDKTDISASLRIEEKLGIPVVMLNGTITMLDSTYRFLGRILGDSARADTLARYCRTTLDIVRSVAARIPDDRRVRVYYAEGLQGLETDSKGSIHTEVLEMAGGINVADIPLLQGYGRATVSFEQLLLWKPQLILVCPDHGHPGGTGHYTNIMSNPSWRALDVIKNGNVYEIPAIPFNCFDRPPSVNRILGLVWLANLLYPDYFKVDIRAEVKKFYALFYHKNLTDAELDKVLLNAVRKNEPRGVKKGQ